jgi:hypothetical protein
VADARVAAGDAGEVAVFVADEVAGFSAGEMAVFSAGEMAVFSAGEIVRPRTIRSGVGPRAASGGFVRGRTISPGERGGSRARAPAPPPGTGSDRRVRGQTAAYGVRPPGTGSARRVRGRTAGSRGSGPPDRRGRGRQIVGDGAARSSGREDARSSATGPPDRRGPPGTSSASAVYGWVHEYGSAYRSDE